MPAGKRIAPININRLPRPVFRDLEQLNRTKRMMLGLPVPISHGSKVPWGYIRKDNDKTTFYPLEEHIRLLRQAAELLDSCSYQEVSDWLSRKTGDSISHFGLYKIMLDRRPFKEVYLPYDERLRLAATF